MHRLLIPAAALALVAAAPVHAETPASPQPSSNSFLYRGHNPGHIVGNTLRRMYWGSGYDSRRITSGYTRSR